MQFVAVDAHSCVLLEPVSLGRGLGTAVEMSSEQGAGSALLTVRRIELLPGIRCRWPALQLLRWRRTSNSFGWVVWVPAFAGMTSLILVA